MVSSDEIAPWLQLERERIEAGHDDDDDYDDDYDEASEAQHDDTTARRLLNAAPLNTSGELPSPLLRGWPGHFWRLRRSHRLLVPLLWGPLAAGAVVLFVQQHQAPPSPLLRWRHPTPSFLPPRPPLESLIGDMRANVTGDVAWLLDFALIGHSKCGTTTQLHWLNQHPQALTHDEEIHSLTRNRPAELVARLYELRNGTKEAGPHPLKRGYKAPWDVASPEALHWLRTYWPSTKLVVGVRHPVRWLESYVNFAARQLDQHKRRKDLFRNRTAVEALATGIVSPRRADFHVHLSRMGKTPLADSDELRLLGEENGRPSGPVVPRMTNPVFLYEASQPFDTRDGRDAQYRKDLQAFLGLVEPLPPIPPRTDGSPNYHYAVDICDDVFVEVRRELVKTGRAAADWILRYFIRHPTVAVSSPERFEELLRAWSTDPCDESHAAYPS